MDSNKYFAFISYSHKDKKEAKELYHRLNYYRLPLKMINEYKEKEGRILPKSLAPIFIDDMEMAKSTVHEGMLSGLARSRFLIVVCSPNSAKSTYVNEEVEYFIKTGRGNCIIPYIIKGTTCSGNPDTECYPPAMRDPDRLGADVQSLKGDAALRVIATMLDVDMGVLAQREKQRRERFIIAVTSVIICFALAFGFYNKQMKDRISGENRKYRSSLSEQFIQLGTGLEQRGLDQEAFMYYSESLKADPSNLAAKMCTLASLQKQGWSTASEKDLTNENVGASDEKKSSASNGKNISASDGKNTDASDEKNTGVSDEHSVFGDNGTKEDNEYGVLVKTGLFGNSYYHVYYKGQCLTLHLIDTDQLFQVVLSDTYSPDYFLEETYEIQVALVGDHNDIRMLVLLENNGFVYSFDTGSNLNNEVLSGNLEETFVIGSLLDGIISEDEKKSAMYNWVAGIYGSTENGLAVISIGTPKEYPILYDAFRQKCIGILDLQGDYQVKDASFDEIENKIALLVKVHPESAALNSHIHFYNLLGEYELSAGDPDKESIIRNIDFSADGKTLLFCSNDSIHIYSTKTGKDVCPPLSSKVSFLHAGFSTDDRIEAEFVDGTRTDFSTHYFRMSKSPSVAKPDNRPEAWGDASIAINDNLLLQRRDPDILLEDRNGNILDEVKDIMNLPQGMNDGILWWGGISADRESSVAYCYGFMEKVFYRIKYDEEACIIINAEPIVLSGRQTNAAFAFDGMCAVLTTDGYLLGYHNDESEPFFAFDFKKSGSVVSFNWLENNMIAIVFRDYSPGGGFSLQLWDVKNGTCLTTLEEASEEEIKDVRYSDGILSYWKGQQSRCWLLNTIDPDTAAVRFLSGLSCYKMDETGSKEFGTPVLYEDLGNWSEILTVE